MIVSWKRLQRERKRREVIKTFSFLFFLSSFLLPSNLPSSHKMSKMVTYYDPVSPWGYIGLKMCQRYQKAWDLDIEVVLINLAYVMNQSGNSPPVKVISKGIWMFEDMARASWEVLWKWAQRGLTWCSESTTIYLLSHLSCLTLWLFDQWSWRLQQTSPITQRQQSAYWEPSWRTWSPSTCSWNLV